MSFILLGQHRSGTSYILDLIRHHPYVDTINEPFSMHLDFFRKNEEVWDENDYVENILHESLKAYPETIEFIKDLNKWLNFPFPSIRGFKETALFEKWSWLRKVINFNKTIIAIRDPRAVIASVLKRNMHNSWWNYKGRIEEYYLNKITDKSVLEIPSMVCAVIWKCRMEYIINIIKTETCFVVRLEDIVNQPLNELEKLMNFLGLDIHSDQKRFILETSKESRDSTYSNFREKDAVLHAWKNQIKGKEREMVENFLCNELIFFKYV